MFKSLTTAAFAVALATFPAERADADAGDVVGGLIVGGLIGAAIANGNNRPTASAGNSRPSGSSRPTVNRIPATQHGRDTQTALNYFGFNAGAVDGQIGRGTRAAIERYQASMGYPINGREYGSYQYDQLMQAYYWALNGGAAQTGLVGQPLLIAYRNAQLAPQQPQVVVVPQAPVAQPTPQVVVAPQPTTPQGSTQVVAQPPIVVAPAPQPNK